MADKTELSEWLSSMDWTYFETLTFAREQSTWSALKAYDRFNSDLLECAALESCALAVCEEGKTFGRLHLHAVSRVLQTNMFPPTTDDLEKLWEKRHGWARVRAFQVDAGGPEYLTKYVTKALHTDRCDYRYVGDWSTWTSGCSSTSTRSDGVSGPAPRASTSTCQSGRGSSGSTILRRSSVDVAAGNITDAFRSSGTRVIDPD